MTAIGKRRGLLLGIFVCPRRSAPVALTIMSWLIVASPAGAQCELQELTSTTAEANSHFGRSVSIAGDWIVVGARRDSLSLCVDTRTPCNSNNDCTVGVCELAGGPCHTDSDCPPGGCHRDPKRACHSKNDCDGFLCDSPVPDVCIGGSSCGIKHAGSATMYRRSGQEWVEAGQLFAPDAFQGAQFATSVAVEGNTVIVGAPTDNEVGQNSGVAYVFRHKDRDPSLEFAKDAWILEAKLRASDATSNQRFGASVAISGSVLTVGATRAGITTSGAVYVFERIVSGTPLDLNGVFWVEQDVITASDAAIGDRFGESVSIHGDTLIVGASGTDDVCPTESTCDSGSAYIFRRDRNETPFDSSDDTWVEEEKLVASDPSRSHGFGASVSISNESAIVGASGDDHACPGSIYCYSGAAYVFQREDNATLGNPAGELWHQAAKLVASDAARNDEFGRAVAISNDIVVVGAQGADCPPVFGCGAAYVFRRDGVGWVEWAKLIKSNSILYDRFGWSVSIDDGRALVGTYRIGMECSEDLRCDLGTAHVFDLALMCSSLADVAKFQNCFQGNGGAIPERCLRFDLDSDSNVNLEDYVAFLETLTGPPNLTPD